MRNASLRGILLAVLCAGLIAGCSDSDPVSEPGSGLGTMQIKMIDAPGDYDAVNVEVIEVMVQREGTDPHAGWHTLSEDTTRVNLLDLANGNYVVLADSTLPVGEYSQVRLILGANNDVVVDGETYPLTIPSSAQTGLKLNHPFTIAEGQIYGVTLDFDADRSVNQLGNGDWVMKPVIRLIVDGLSGSITGTIEPVEARAMVMALAGGDTTIAWADTLSGDFAFPMLMQGDYDLEISATEGAFADTTLTGVTVTAGAETDVGTVTLESE